MLPAPEARAFLERADGWIPLARERRKVGQG